MHYILDEPNIIFLSLSLCFIFCNMWEFVVKQNQVFQNNKRKTEYVVKQIRLCMETLDFSIPLEEISEV